jgi:hypothetical protein
LHSKIASGKPFFFHLAEGKDDRTVIDDAAACRLSSGAPPALVLCLDRDDFSSNRHPDLASGGA